MKSEMWQRYGWGRASILHPSVFDERPNIPTEQVPFVPTTEDLVAILNRRSARSFARSDLALAKEKWKLIETTLLKIAKETPWISIRFVNQGVEGLRTGLYSLNSDRQKFDLIRNGSVNINPIVQNQWWTKGNGVSLFFVVDWKTATRCFQGPQGYTQMWMALGQVCQHILHAVSVAELVARMTPAIQESLAKEILLISQPTEEATYFLRIGEERHAHNKLRQ